MKQNPIGRAGQIFGTLLSSRRVLVQPIFTHFHC